MKVAQVSSGLSFGRSLRQEELGEFKQTLQEGKQLAGQTGKSILIMPSTSLPQSEGFNTGVGYLTSNDGLKYVDDMRTYTDFNVYEDMPLNQFDGNHYNGASFELGDHNINPELLTKEEYNSILTKEEFDGIVKANNKETKDTLANFENVTGKDSPQNSALKKAHERFLALDENSALKQKYNKFVQENDAWLNFAREGEPDQEFFKFKKFLAEDHAALGKQKLNERGIKYAVDVALNVTDDEVKAFPKAFKQDHFIGVPKMKIPSLDFDTILDEASDSHKFLEMKFKSAAKRGDIVRVDSAWTYVTPVITPKGEEQVLDHNRKAMGSSVVELFEKWFKEVKGDAYDAKNIIYEFEAGPNDFSPFWDGKLIPAVKDRVNIYQNTYLSDNWGSNEAFLNRGYTADELTVGANHDVQPMKQVANGVPDSINGNQVHKNASIEPLAKILHLDPEKLKNPVEFFKAKFAEMMTGKNNHFFFMDIPGSGVRFNEHTCELGTESATNFRSKVPVDYMKRFTEALKEGFAFNIMDSLEKVFTAKGLNDSHPEIYAKIVKFRDILVEDEDGAKAAAAEAVDLGTNAAAEVSKPVAQAAEAASDAAGTVAEGAKKAGKSYKPLWIAAGVVAVAGGAYALYKNRYPKPVHKEETKVQEEPKKPTV